MIEVISHVSILKLCMYSVSSIGIADMHPIVVFVSAGTSERFTADIHFKLEVSTQCLVRMLCTVGAIVSDSPLQSSSTYVRGQCVQWMSAVGDLSA